MAEAIIHSSRGEKRVEKIADKKASQSEDDILQINDDEALLFDKPKESKTKFRSQSKSSKSSKPAALGKALPLQPRLLRVLCQRLELIVVLVVTLRLKFYIYYRSLGPNRKRPTVV